MMRTLIKFQLLILGLIFTSVLLADTVVVVGQPPAAAPPAGWTGNLVSTDFEGTGLPSGWAVTSGSPNWDNTTSPQEGAQDLMMNASAETDIYNSFSAQTELWIKFKFRYSTSTGTQFLYITTAGAQYISLGISLGGRLEIYQSGSLITDIPVDTLSTGTSYFIWMHVKTGGGGNAVYDVEFATTDSRVGSGSKFVSYSTGLQTQSFTAVNPYHAAASSATFQFDNFNVGNSTYASTTYLVNQGFDGTGYDNSESWSEAVGGGSEDEDYTGTVLAGSQSLRLTSSADVAGTTITFSGTGEVWGYCLFRMATGPSVQNVVVINDAGGTPMFSVYVDGSGNAHSYNYSGGDVATADAMSSGTTYSVWWHFAKGSGSNAVGDVEFSTTTTKTGSGTKFAQTTNGNQTTNAGQLQLGGIAGSFTCDSLYDYVRLDDVVIGSAPP